MHNLHTVIVQSMASFFIVCCKKSSNSNTEKEKKSVQLERLELELFSNLGLKLHKPFLFFPFEKSMMAALGLWPIGIDQKEEDGSALK